MELVLGGVQFSQNYGYKKKKKIPYFEIKKIIKGKSRQIFTLSKYKIKKKDEGVESFLGKQIHSTLESIYEKISSGRTTIFYDEMKRIFDLT